MQVLQSEVAINKATVSQCMIYDHTLIISHGNLTTVFNRFTV